MGESKSEPPLVLASADGQSREVFVLLSQGEDPNEGKFHYDVNFDTNTS